MNILGVGTEELVLIIIILVVVAGPKRMIKWTYEAGKYLARFKAMFDETWGAIRKEFEDAQVDLPKQPLSKDAPFRVPSITGEVSRAIKSEAAKITAPLTAGVNGSKLTTGTNGANGTAAAVADSSAPPAPNTPDATDAGEEKGYDAWRPS
jgi:Sec-independent protein translocase protein TatA